MENGPQNAVVGDTYGIDLPITEVPQQDLTEERNLAKFSRTAEFKRLERHLQERIEFYKSQRPDGRDVRAVDNYEQLARDWKVANSIIAELQAIIDVYKRAAEVVSESDARSENA